MQKNIRVNFTNDSKTPDFIVDLKEWNGAPMTHSFISEVIQSLINDLENGDAKGFTYSLCGDTLVLVTDEDGKDFPYVVSVCKVTHRGFARKAEW
jgi:hypothetical protein